LEFESGCAKCVGGEAETMSSQKLEALDFVIAVLQEHERELSKEIARLASLLRYYEPIKGTKQ